MGQAIFPLPGKVLLMKPVDWIYPLSCPTFKKLHGILVNCIVPGFVVTGIAIPPLVAVISKRYVTPMDSMMRGFDVLLDDKERAGAELKVSVNKVYFRDPVAYIDKLIRWLVKVLVKHYVNPSNYPNRVSSLKEV
jgi:hypothetical protein